MSKKILLFLVVNIILLNLNVFGYLHVHNKQAEVRPEPPREMLAQPNTPIQPPPPVTPEPTETKPNITFTVPNGDMRFQEICQQLVKWNQEAPQITEVGVVGKTQNGTDIPYIRIGKKTGPKLMIHACVHGNEHLCCSVSMGCMGKLLSSYMVDEEVTKLIRERDLYYVPVVCPESYMKNSRHDMGKDPNRNFSGPNLQEIQSIPSIEAIKKFHLEHKFKSVMSCHNHGRIYFIPWGYVQKQTDSHAEYRRILSAMGQSSGYTYQQLLRQSAPPYYGYEADWYYHHGALSMVNEIGRSMAANPSETKSETDSNYSAFKIWIRESPLVRK
jgi:predicted deacylase